MSLDPTLQAALGTSGVTAFCAVRIVLPATVLRLVDGAGMVAFDPGSGTVETFVGLDPVFGVIGGIDKLSGADGQEAPEWRLSLYPADGASAATLASPAMQGAKAAFFVGAIDPSTGSVVGAPKLQVLGEIDVPTVNSSEHERSVDYTVTSVFERLFADDEGVRASDGWHQSVWPGELGLGHVTGTLDNLYWGGKPPAGYQGASIPVPYNRDAIAPGGLRSPRLL